MALPGLTPSQETGNASPSKQRLETILGEPGTTCKYERVKKLGIGSFGEAWLVTRKSDGAKLVAKVMDLSQMTAKDHKYVEAEVQCLAACNHFAIIKYHEDVTQDQKMLIVMEYADAGDLNMQIKARANEGNRYFEEHEVGYTFVQLAMALDHIHRQKMLHRDIKGANVLLMHTGLIKLGDFGFSQQYEETVSGAVAKTFCGTPYYLAPELWRRQRYSKKADVWALGILLYEMMALRRPFVGQGMRALMEAVIANEIPELPEKFRNSDLKAIVAALLVPDPNERPSIVQLFHMPQMQKLLRDFEVSVQASKLIGADIKTQIAANIREIRETPINSDAGTATGTVGTIRTDVTFEGNIRKESTDKGQRVWKDRYLSLRNGELYISVKKGEKEAKPLSLTEVDNVIPVPYHAAKADGVFAINLHDNKTMWMQAASRTECYEWIHKIQQAMGVA